MANTGPGKPNTGGRRVLVIYNGDVAFDSLIVTGFQGLRNLLTSAGGYAGTGFNFTVEELAVPEAYNAGQTWASGSSYAANNASLPLLASNYCIVFDMRFNNKNYNNGSGTAGPRGTNYIRGDSIVQADDNAYASYLASGGGLFILGDNYYDDSVSRADGFISRMENMYQLVNLVASTGVVGDTAFKLGPASIAAVPAGVNPYSIETDYNVLAGSSETTTYPGPIVGTGSGKIWAIMNGQPTQGVGVAWDGPAGDLKPAYNTGRMLYWGDVSNTNAWASGGSAAMLKYMQNAIDYLFNDNCCTPPAVLCGVGPDVLEPTDLATVECFYDATHPYTFPAGTGTWVNGGDRNGAGGFIRNTVGLFSDNTLFQVNISAGDLSLYSGICFSMRHGLPGSVTVQLWNQSFGQQITTAPATIPAGAGWTDTCLTFNGFAGAATQIRFRVMYSGGVSTSYDLDAIGLKHSCGSQPLVVDGACCSVASPTFTPTATRTRTRTPTPTLTATRTVTVSPSHTPTVTPSRTLTQTPSMTLTFSPTPTASPSRTASDTPTLTVTFTATPTWTPSRTASATPTLTVTFTATSTWTPSRTQTASPTWTPTVTASATVSDTNTVGPSPTYTATRTDSPTATPSFSPSGTPTVTPSQTATPTQSDTPSVTPTITVTTPFSPTSTPTQTLSFSPSETPTQSQTLSDTPTLSASPTQTLTATPTASATASLTPSFTSTITVTLTPSPSVTVTHSFTVSPTITPTPIPVPVHLTVSLYNAAGERVRVLFQGGARSVPTVVSLSDSLLLSGEGGVSIQMDSLLSDGSSALLWSGENDSGQYVSSGTYYFKLEFADSFGSSTSFIKGVEVLQPPGGQELRVFNSAGELVWFQALSGSASGTLGLDRTVLALDGDPGSATSGPGVGVQVNGVTVTTWNGSNRDGAPVASGSYLIQLTTQSAGSGVQVQSQSLTVLASGVNPADSQAIVGPNPWLHDGPLWIRYKPFAGAYGSCELYNLAGERVGAASDPARSGAMSLSGHGLAGGVYLLDFRQQRGSTLLVRRSIKVAIVK